MSLFVVANQTMAEGGSDERKPCLLSLDGGGVRGLSSLYLLKQLMERINPNETLKPYEIFDMIGGTSTGGLIAIMLGRLHMSVDECIEAYQSLSSTVFTRLRPNFKWNGNLQGSFDTRALERVLKDVIRSATKNEEELFYEAGKEKCNVSVQPVVECSRPLTSH